MTEGVGSLLDSIGSEIPVIANSKSGKELDGEVDRVVDGVFKIFEGEKPTL